MTFYKKISLVTLGVTSALSLSVSAQAATISGLYNTGVDNSGNVLAVGVADSHYVITAVTNPSGDPTTLAAQISTLLPLAPTVSQSNQWSSNDAAGSAGSAWLTPKVKADNTPERSGSFIPVGNPVASARTFDYTLNFNIGTLDPNSAMLSGNLQADNFARILLNGVDLGGQAPVAAPGNVAYFRNFTAFGINSGFVAGANTLTFKVYDYGVITGLRVTDLIGTAVPEPATWAMMIAGFGLVAGQARRRRRNGTAVTA
jgi:hypothetical protein